MSRLVLLQPFLFALFPILATYSRNVHEVPPEELVAPSLVVAVATLPLLGAATFVARDIRPAAMVVSLFWVMFFSYGHLSLWIQEASLEWIGIGRREVLLPAWGTAMAALIYLVAKSRRYWEASTIFLNGMAVVLVVMPAGAIAPGLLWQPIADPELSLPMASPDRSGHGPNIYYIVLDSYARGDVLQDIYGYDNRWFLDELRARGFYVASGSSANYPQTCLSMASTLNMLYLDDLAARLGKEAANRQPLKRMVGSSVVASFLKRQGYSYVAFSSGYFDSSLKRADLYAGAPWSLNLLESTLLDTTPILAISPIWRDMHRSRLLHLLDHLADPLEMREPVFVLAHVMAPHPPFVLGNSGEGTRDGEPQQVDGRGTHFLSEQGDCSDYVRGYREQLDFLNGKVLSAIDSILRESPEPPVIILQSDHGPTSVGELTSMMNLDLRERMSILNAYRLPGEAMDQLYEDITPVNSFRVVLNRYFGTDLPMLEDRSYFSTIDHPYSFVDVTREVRPAARTRSWRTDLDEGREQGVFGRHTRSDRPQAAPTTSFTTAAAYSTSSRVMWR